MSKPTISIIMPVCNTAEYLPGTISALQKQRFGDFEVICVDCGSAHGAEALLGQTAGEDSRFRWVAGGSMTAGEASDLGFSMAQGDYVMFLPCSDGCSDLLLEKLYQAITDREADIAACNVVRLYPDGSEVWAHAVHTRYMPRGAVSFRMEDTPDHIFRVFDPVVWNRLYRSSFLRRHELHFGALPCGQAVFAAVTMGLAERVTYIDQGPSGLVRHRELPPGPIPMDEALRGTEEAMDGFLQRTEGLNCPRAVLSFVAEQYAGALSRYVTDFSAPAVRAFYEKAHRLLNSEGMCHLEPEHMTDMNQNRAVQTIRTHDYEAMCALRRKRLIVSVTSFPKRIDSVHLALESIYAQTKQPDQVILWLAEEQFPEREQALPAQLLQLVEDKGLSIRWCDDLRSHKKYFYAFQEYPEDLVVTIDDDLTYPEDMLETLYASYLQYPEAVSTVRAHLIVLDESGQVLPYRQWIQETDACQQQPCMQFMATSGAGVLHPPGLFRREFFDKQAIKDTCLWADDLWLKAMQLVSDVPVVVVWPYRLLQRLPTAKVEPLEHINVGQHQNDAQWGKISRWLDETFEPGILKRKLTRTDVGTVLLGASDVVGHVNTERKTARSRANEAQRKLTKAETENKQLKEQTRQLRSDNGRLNRQLQQTKTDLQQTKTDLQKTRTELQQMQKDLQQTSNEKADLSARLDKTREELTRTRQEKDALSRRLKKSEKQRRDENPHLRLQDVRAGLTQQKQEKGLSAGLVLRFGMYYLAKGLSKLLAGAMYYLNHGFKASLKKLFGR